MLSGNSKSGRAAVLAFHALITLGSILVVYFVQNSSIPPEQLIRPISIYNCLCIIWMVCSWKIATGSGWEAYTILFTAAAVFHTSQMFLESLNLNINGFLGGAVPPVIALEAIDLVSLSILMMHFGALLGAFSMKSRIPIRALEAPGPEVSFVGWSLVAVSLLPTAYLLFAAVRAAQSNGYFFAMFQRQSEGTIEIACRTLERFLIPGALYLLASSKNQPSRRWISLAVVAFDSGAYFYIGSRTFAIVALVSYTWLWDRVVRPIPRRYLLAAGSLFMFVVFPLVALTRTDSGATKSLDYVSKKWSSIENPMVNSLAETGATLATVGYTLELVPEARPHDQGMSYLMALLTAFPNLFWDQHPAITRGTPANWVLQMVDPVMAASGGGLGYSLIAEAYFNFGWFAPLGLFVLGLGMGKLVARVEGSHDVSSYAATAALLIPLLWLVRNESAGAFRDIVWSGIAPFVAVRLLSKLITRRRFRHGER